MARVTHFEISVENMQNAIEFYRNVFGWQIEKWEGPIDYWLIKTGEDSEPGIDGALMEKSEGFPGIVNTVEVVNLDESIQKVLMNGGQQKGEIHNIPDVGIFVYCTDREDNLFGMMQSIRS